MEPSKLNLPQTGKIQTVLGTIDPGKAGPTLTHEHLLSSLTPYAEAPETASEAQWVDAPITIERLGWIHRRKYVNREVLRLHDERVATVEAREFALAGGGTIVDATSRGIGRDPLGLARISRATGLSVVMGASYYVPRAHPPGTDRKSEEELYEETVSEILTGVGETGIRAGVIGEIGTVAPLEDVQLRILRSAAKAAMATGCPITIHPPLDNSGALDVMQVLLDEGMEPDGIIIGHLGMAMSDPAAVAELASTGCYLQYDHFGGFEDTTFQYSYSGKQQALSQDDVARMASLEMLADKGSGDRLLVGHDVCLQIHLASLGGKGYAHLLTNITGRMRRMGFGDDLIHSILVGNPARALTFREPS